MTAPGGIACLTIMMAQERRSAHQITYRRDRFLIVENLTIRDCPDDLCPSRPPQRCCPLVIYSLPEDTVLQLLQ